jgi:hypothetical protein
VEDETNIEGLLETKNLFLTIFASSFFLLGIVYFSIMLYLDRHKSSTAIAWDCIPLTLAVLFLSWFWSTTPGDVDLRRDFMYGSVLAYSVALMNSIVVFHVMDKHDHAPLWASIPVSSAMFISSHKMVMDAYYEGREWDKHKILHEALGGEWPPTSFCCRCHLES